MKKKKSGYRKCPRKKSPKPSRTPRKFVSFHDAAMGGEMTPQELENLQPWHD